LVVLTIRAGLVVIVQFITIETGAGITSYRVGALMITSVRIVVTFVDVCGR